MIKEQSPENNRRDIGKIKFNAETHLRKIKSFTKLSKIIIRLVTFAEGAKHGINYLWNIIRR